MNRDSNVWWIVAGAGFFGSLAAQPELIEKVMELQPQAIVAVLAMAFGILGGVMRASPINGISEEGRKKFMDDAKP